MLIDLKQEISQGNKVEASTKLYNKMDGFISDSIFGNNNTKWVWWLLPLNVIILFIFIKIKIGQNATQHGIKIIAVQQLKPK